MEYILSPYQTTITPEMCEERYAHYTHMMNNQLLTRNARAFARLSQAIWESYYHDVKPIGDLLHELFHH